jgi:outer membrane protein TolC
MKTTKVLFSVVLMVVLVTPVSAQSEGDWVRDFLRSYTPPKVEATAAAPPPVVGQVFQTGTVPITMQDIINMMLDFNLDIQSNRLGPRSSYLSTLVFYRALQPSLRITANTNRNTAPSTSQLNGALSLSQLRHNFAVNFSQQLPYGTSVTVDATMNRLSNNSSNATFNPSYTGNIVYSVGQKLLRDRGRRINMRSIIVGQNNEKMSETQFEIQVTNLLVEAQKTYWDLVFATEDLKVKQRSLDVAEITLDQNKSKVEIGILARIEVKQTESEVANRRQQLIQSTGSVTTSEDQIKKLISSETDPRLFLVRLATQDLPRKPAAINIPALEEAVRVALENRPELRQAALELQNRDLDVEYTKNQKLPILDLTASYTQNGVGGTQTIRGNQIGSPVIEVRPGGIWDAFGQLFSYNYGGFSMGFSFTLPLSNKAANADYDRALNERRLTESRLNITRQQIALEVRNALTAIDQARASIETAQIARELAVERLDAEQTKFELGTSTLRFVLEEQRNVAQAETAELQTLVTFTKAVVDLDKAMGLTLMKNNIQIDKALEGSAVASRSLMERSRAGN